MCLLGSLFIRFLLILLFSFCALVFLILQLQAVSDFALLLYLSFMHTFLQHISLLCCLLLTGFLPFLPPCFCAFLAANILKIFLLLSFVLTFLLFGALHSPNLASMIVKILAFTCLLPFFFQLLQDHSQLVVICFSLYFLGYKHSCRLFVCFVTSLHTYFIAFCLLSVCFLYCFLFSCPLVSLDNNCFL